MLQLGKIVHNKMQLMRLPGKSWRLSYIKLEGIKDVWKQGKIFKSALQNFWEKANPLLHLAFLSQSWKQLLILRSLPAIHSMTHILDLPGTFDELMRRKSTLLLMECEVKKSHSLSLDRSGNLLLKTDMSISKSCLLQWILATTHMTFLRTLLGGLHLSKRIIHLLNIPSTRSPNGIKYLQLGKTESSSCTPIVNSNYEDTSGSLAMFFMLHPVTHLLRSTLMLKFKNVMNTAHIDWMTAIRFSCRSLHRCSMQVLALVLGSAALGLSLHSLILQKGLPPFALIGILVSVRTCVLIVASMVPALSVEVHTEPEMLTHASLYSKLAVEKQLAEDTRKAVEEAVIGPRTFKNPLLK